MSDSSSQKQTNKNETSAPAWSGASQQELNCHRDNASAALTTTSRDSIAITIPKQHNILFFLLVVGYAFALLLSGFGGFDNELVDLNIKLELERNTECNSDDLLPPRTNNTIGVTDTPSFNFDPIGVKSSEFINLGCDLNVELTVMTITTIVSTIKIITMLENKSKSKIKMKYEIRPNAPHKALPIDPVVEVGSFGVGLHEFNVNECMFDGSMNGTSFDNDTTYRGRLSRGLGGAVVGATVVGGQAEVESEVESQPEGILLKEERTSIPATVSNCERKERKVCGLLKCDTESPNSTLNSSDKGPLSQPEQAPPMHVTVPLGNKIYNCDPIDAELREFDDLKYIFNAIINENEFKYDSKVNENFDNANCNIHYCASADIIGTKLCLFDGAGFKTTAAKTGLCTASAEEHDQPKKPEKERIQ